MPFQQIGLLLLTLLLLLMQPRSALAQSAQNFLVFEHVAVIDATGTPAQSDMTVIIRGEYIDTVGKTGAVFIPKSAQVVDAVGQFLIPGFWDMHVHHPSDEVTRKIFFPLYIANGVTGVRDMFGDRYKPSSANPVDLKRVNQWRQEIAGRTLIGPRIVASSAIVDGPKPVWTGSIPVATSSEGRQAVDMSKQRGADFVKVYSLLPRDAYFAIADEAKKQTISFAGHVPFSVSASEASDAGQKSIEHLTGILLACSTLEDKLQKQLRQVSLTDKEILLNVSRSQIRSLLDTYIDTKAKALFNRFVQNRTWQVPTLTVLQSYALITDADFANDPRLRYMPAKVRETWKQQRDSLSKRRTSEDITNLKEAFHKQLEVVGAMHQAGVEIMAGTDTLNAHVFPGFSLHDELALLVKAGVKPMAALQAATRNPANYLGLSDSLGTVEPGKIADLVLLDANPLEQISNTQKIAAVVVRGQLITKTALKEMLSKVELTASKRGMGWNIGVIAWGSLLVIGALFAFWHPRTRLLMRLNRRSV